LAYGLAGHSGVGHCGCDGIDIRMENDAAATRAGGRAASWALRLFIANNGPETIDRFSSSQGRAATNCG
jgi:hypothetical protein